MNEGHAEIALNLVWVLMAGFLVMFMQVGFAMVETGFTRAKNAVNTMAMNLIIYPIGVLGFWLVGYGLMEGGVVIWLKTGGSGTRRGYQNALSQAMTQRDFWPYTPCTPPLSRDHP
jgi:ammonia channel protein AmtB